MDDDIEIKEEFFSPYSSKETKEKFVHSWKAIKKDCDLSKELETECTVEIKRLEEAEVIYIWNSFQEQEGPSKDALAQENIGTYECAICWSQFKNSMCLNVHLCSHEKKLPQSSYIDCRANYVRKTSYRCVVCEAKFSRSNHLKAHMTIHTGERPYKCDLCEAKFSSRGNLTIHRRTHTGERPYTCEVCKIKFARMTYLKGHMRTHTGERPYRCAFCDARFNAKGTLNKHIKRIHSLNKPLRYKVVNLPMECKEKT